MKSFRSLTMHRAKLLHNSGDISIADLSQAMAKAAGLENPELGAFTNLFGCSDFRSKTTGVLNGFTAAIKANIAGGDWPTHCGSKLLADYISPYDSTVVHRLRNAGCGFSGITTMDEFGMGSTCEHTTLGKVVNPWNFKCSAGGSSGGSAAAVAAGHSWFGLGSDTGGSVRLPAHFCGVVGLKPTYGRISRYGLVAFASSLDTIGILARDVIDASAVLNVIAGRDAKDSTSSSMAVLAPDFEISLCLKGLSVAVPNELDQEDLDPEVWQDYQQTMNRLKNLGANLVSMSFKDVFNSVAAYTVLNCAEAASNLHRFDGTLYGQSEPGATHQQSLVFTRNKGFGPEVKRRLLWGAHVLSEGYREQYYMKACEIKKSLCKHFQEVFAQVQLIALPTAPNTAIKLGVFNDNPVRMHLMDKLTVPASLAGLPAVTIPTSVDSHGLPHSIQLIGPHFSESLMLQWAHVLESDLKFRQLGDAPWQKNN